MVELIAYVPLVVLAVVCLVREYQHTQDRRAWQDLVVTLTEKAGQQAREYRRDMGAVIALLEKPSAGIVRRATEHCQDRPARPGPENGAGPEPPATPFEHQMQV